jgi:hypothetical protein
MQSSEPIQNQESRPADITQDKQHKDKTTTSQHKYDQQNVSTSQIVHYYTRHCPPAVSAWRRQCISTTYMTPMTPTWSGGGG